MFTGIITQRGKIKSISTKDEMLELWIESGLTKNKNIGDSISIDGACFTITETNEDSFKVEAMPETQNTTKINSYKENDKVNMELPLKVGDSLDGHFVSGHIDYVGDVLRIDENTNSKVLSISIPKKYYKYYAMKGSVTVNGVSLTVSKVNEDDFEVSLIPETLKNTNLNDLKKGDQVNIEVDLLTRYLESLLNEKEKHISYQFLQERGFI